MNRQQFEHTIRAVGSILQTDEVLVIGSQALHASVIADLPEEAQRSVAVDVAVLGDLDGRMADLIDGSIGEASMFHATFGYYAQGVTEATAIVPRGWRDRLVAFQTPATGGVIAQCLESHDLWIAKAIANRPKDVEFCSALLSRQLVDPMTLRARLQTVDNLDKRIAQIVEARISAAT